MYINTVYALHVAGGIGTYLHADYVKTLLPESITYHAMADAGLVYTYYTKQVGNLVIMYIMYIIIIGTS